MKLLSRKNLIVFTVTYVFAVLVIVVTGCKNNAENKNINTVHEKYPQIKIPNKMKTVKQIKINPDPYKPYNLAQGYKVDNMLYISGQAAYAEDGSLVGKGNFDLQAKQTFLNLKKVLEAGGSSLENVIKVTIFLKDMGNFDKIVALRQQYFKPPYPADTIVEISALYSPDALLEIEAIAITNEAAIIK